MSSPPVVIYCYNGSPFVRKLEVILALKGIDYARVEVPMVPPRPQLEALGIDYRRVPVLAIGRDVYCDTMIIATALDRHFPSSKGYPLIFSPRKDGGKVDAGALKAFSAFYTDKVLFALGQQAVPWKKLPKALVEDRFSMVGTKVQYKEALALIEKGLPLTRINIELHLELFEGQLSDGREWLFDTVTPSYADVSSNSPLAWMRSFRDTKATFDRTKFPKALDWMDRMATLIAQKEKALNIRKITSDDAVKVIVSSAPEDIASIVGFDAVAASGLSVQKGDSVLVAPDDTGKIPTKGKLVALSRGEVVIETVGENGASVRVHFPRLGYSITPERQTQAKL